MSNHNAGKRLVQVAVLVHACFISTKVKTIQGNRKGDFYVAQLFFFRG